MALAPSFDLLLVPSRSSRAWSTSRCSDASNPTSSGPITSSTAFTAFATPLPAYRPPPSRSSTASNAPVDAPEGTAARLTVPSSRATSTSTVGLPRESRISRAPTASIDATVHHSPGQVLLWSPTLVGCFGADVQARPCHQASYGVAQLLLGVEPGVAGRGDQLEEPVAHRHRGDVRAGVGAGV